MMEGIVKSDIPAVVQELFLLLIFEGSMREDRVGLNCPFSFKKGEKYFKLDVTVLNNTPNQLKTLRS